MYDKELESKVQAIVPSAVLKVNRACQALTDKPSDYINLSLNVASNIALNIIVNIFDENILMAADKNKEIKQKFEEIFNKLIKQLKEGKESIFESNFANLHLISCAKQ